LHIYRVLKGDASRQLSAGDRLAQVRAPLRVSIANGDAHALAAAAGETESSLCGTGYEHCRLAWFDGSDGALRFAVEQDERDMWHHTNISRKEEQPAAHITETKRHEGEQHNREIPASFHTISSFNIPLDHLSNISILG